MIFDLVNELSTTITAMPNVHRQYSRLRLIQQAILRDLHCIDRHSTALFQCLWNNGWWYDASDAAHRYMEPETGWNAGNAPWLRPDANKMCRLVENWRQSKTDRTPGALWIRSQRPPEINLGTPSLLTINCEGVVTRVALSPDGRWIVSGS